MYSLKYGTVPAGSAAPEELPTPCATSTPRPAGTGVVFNDFDTGGLPAIRPQALEWYASPALWRRLVTNGMREDFSWNGRCEEYERLYASLLAAAREATGPKGDVTLSQWPGQRR